MRIPRTTRRGGWTIIEVLVVAVCLVTVMALTAPAMQSLREAARRSSCKNNLKQIVLALHNYHEIFNSFPPGWISGDASPDSGPRFGWQTMILPQVEEMSIYNRIDFIKPLPAAKGDMQREIATYRCPSDATPAANPLRGGYGTSNYSGNYGSGLGRGFGEDEKDAGLTSWLAPRRAQFWPGQLPPLPRTNGLFWRNSNVKFRDILDGTANTFAVGERCSAGGAGIWPGVGNNAFVNDAVTDCSRGNELNSRYTSFSSNHGGGANFVTCGGSVSFVSDNIAPETYRALSTRNGGEGGGREF